MHADIPTQKHGIYSYQKRYFSFKFICSCVNIITCLWQQYWNVTADCSGLSTVKPQPCETSKREAVDCNFVRKELTLHVHSVQFFAETLSLSYKPGLKTDNINVVLAPGLPLH